MGREEFTALLGAGTEYNGRLSFKGTVRVDGRFAGDIISEGKLILGKDAHVEGTVRVSELVVHGVLRGEVIVTRRSVLHQTARIHANLATALLIMEEGAELHGNLCMGASVEEMAALPAPVLSASKETMADTLPVRQ